MSADLPELLTVPEVATLLRTTPNAIYHQIERGQLPGVVRRGRRVLIRRDDLRAHLGLPVMTGRVSADSENAPASAVRRVSST